MENLPHLRSMLGATAKLWAGEDGVRVEPGRYVALSGAPSVDYNVIVCHGAGENLIAKSVEEIKARGVPALIMVAGQATGEVQELVDAGWVCIGQTGFMGRELDPATDVPAPVPGIRQLEASELDGARAIMADTFGLTPELALVALPPDATGGEGQSVWGIFNEDGELACTTIGARAQDTVTYWGIATPPEARRQGHARRMMDYVMAYDAQLGARYVVAHTTPYGEALTIGMGFVLLERWQMWARPRWVLGRA